jgi:hypothetical protein
MPQYANIPLPYQKFDLYTTKCVTAKGQGNEISRMVWGNWCKLGCGYKLER